MKITKRMRFIPWVVALTSVCHAGVVSYNADNNGTVSASDTLGVVAVTNWYNTWDGAGQNWFYADMEDDSGIATTLNIGFVGANGDWSVGGSKPNADATMLNGYVNGQGVDSAHVYVQDLNPGYDYTVYLYFNSDNGTRVGAAHDDDETYYFGMNPESASSGTYLQATATDASGFGIDANYAVFSVTGVTDQSFYTSVFSSDGVAADFGGITGIQVIETIPEPATLGLVGLFGAGVLFIRRRMSM